MATIPALPMTGAQLHTALTAINGEVGAISVPTTEQLQDLIAAMFQAGTHTNASVAYNDTTGTLSITASGGGGATLTEEEVEDFVGGLVTQGTGISVTYNDAGNVLSIALAGESYTTAEKNKLAALAISHITGLQGALNAKAPLVPEVNAQTGTAYTLALADNGKTITRENGAANTVTIPANATLALPINFTVNVWQIGAGVTTVVGASGVTVNGVSGGSVAVSGANQILALMKTGTNSWSVAGGAA